MKRILSLDGGGIRGVFSLMVLERIEAEFRRARGRPGLVLREEFDFFAGTSTGGIIAAGLAWGLPVATILDLYRTRGAEMFALAAWYYRYWKCKYRSDAIAAFFQELFKEDDGTPALLGSPRLLAGPRPSTLLLTMRNATTGSAWPVCNNPRAEFNRRDRADCNLDIPLWKLLRASSAAPTFFPPEEIVLDGHSGLFVDGGLTPYNNPALVAVLTATLPCYRMEWPTGRDRLLLVSVGTGQVRARLAKTQAAALHTLDFARYIAPAMIGSTVMEQDLVCRVLGDCVHGAAIDSELQGLHGPGLLTETEKKFRYVRYDRRFSAEETTAFEKATRKPFSLDNLDLVPDLIRVGREYADAHVRPEHLGLA